MCVTFGVNAEIAMLDSASGAIMRQQIHRGTVMSDCPSAETSMRVWLLSSDSAEIKALRLSMTFFPYHNFTV